MGICSTRWWFVTWYSLIKIWNSETWNQTNFWWETFLNKSNFIKFIIALHGKCQNTDLFLVSFFPVFELNAESYLKFSPNAEKNGPNKTRYWTSFTQCSLMKQLTKYVPHISVWNLFFFHCFFLLWARVMVFCDLLFYFLMYIFLLKARDLAHEMTKNKIKNLNYKINQ